MAQPQQTVNIMAPGFKGLNTEDSPLSLDTAYATVANNCIIDKYGRLSARKGYSVLTTLSNPSELGTSYIQTMGEFKDSGGNQVIFSAGNNKIFSGVNTLVNETPAGATITANNWKMVNFNDHMYFFQGGHVPMVYSDSLGAVIKMPDHTGFYTGTVPNATDAIATAGRLWCALGSVIYWSDLLNGSSWAEGTSGSIELTKVWPDGYDTVVALAAHNNFLIIFGQHSIIVYQGANEPATMQVSDTIVGAGCVHRDSVQYTGTDVLFLSQSGLRNLGRTIQEKSLPISDLSRNIKSELIEAIKGNTGNIRSLYSPENSFYLVFIPDSNVVYCFDLKGQLENNAYRVTKWVVNTMKCFLRITNGDVYIGNSRGVSVYSGYLDGDDSFYMTYYSPQISLGDSSKLKFLKKIKPTIVGGSGSTLIFKWSYGFTEKYSNYVYQLGSSGTSSVYGEAIYGVSRYSGGTFFAVPNINTTGNGTSFVVGMEALVNSSISLQEFNITTLLGKIG